MADDELGSSLSRVCFFQVEELYDAYCIQRRLRDGASKMVAAFNSATGSREARESLSEANKGYKECTEVNDGPEVMYAAHALVGSCEWCADNGSLPFLIRWK